MRSTIFRKIMVATDGSELVRKAVDSAIEISKLSGAKLYAVHVISLGAYYMMISSRDLECGKEIKDQLIKESKEAIAYVEEAGRAANVEVESVILEGSPAEKLIDFAEKNDIDLIIMGTHGKNGILRSLIGSVAENVVRHSKKSVLVTRGIAIEKGRSTLSCFHTGNFMQK